MEKITIKKQLKSSITKEIPDIKLEDFTIFAGENNAGKTKLVRAIGEELKKKNINVIEIPAERVLVSAEIKTTAEVDPLKKAMRALVKVNFDAKKSLKSFVDDIEKELSSEFSEYKVKNTQVLMKIKGATLTDYESAIQDTYIRKLIDSISIQDGYSNQSGIALEDAGQGTERLIIVSLLKYLGHKRAKISKNKETYIIFEEPEIYLHPKLKETLFDVLVGLAKDKENNIRVIITTHDPQFIEFGKDFLIYKVFRDPKKDKGATQIAPVQKKYLDYESSAEINYLIFDLATKTYVLELYENLRGSLGYPDFDKKLSRKLKIPRDQNPDLGFGKGKITFITRLRHDIAHSKTKKKSESFIKWGKAAIEKLHEYKEGLV